MNAVSAKSCMELLQDRRYTSGFYWLKMDGTNDLAVYCDMDTDGGMFLYIKISKDIEKENNASAFWVIQ